MLKIAFIALLFTTLLLQHGLIAQGLVINEVVADNEWGVVDEDGEVNDWVELYNATDEAIDVGGMGLSDEEGNVFKWVFPSREIEAGGYLVVFASGKDRIDEGELHSNFSVEAEGERILLVGLDGEVIDEVECEELGEDRSWARLPDGEEWYGLETTSFGSTNDSNDIASSSHQGGFYEGAFEVELVNVMGDEIRYTQDGSVPTMESDLFEAGLLMIDRDEELNYFTEFETTPSDYWSNYPLWNSPEEKVDKANVLRFCTFREGVVTSRVETRTYFVDEGINDKYSMPIISLVVEEGDFFSEENGIYVPGADYESDIPFSTGNYFKRGDLWERDVHLEYFDEAGELAFSQDAGIRIHGGYTRIAAQKSLKLYARGEYSMRYFNYQLMPQSENDKYKRFILRTTMGEGLGWGESVIKDELAHVISEDLDFSSQNSRPVIVFLNGEYWGIHTIRDRIDKYYLEYEEGVDIDSIDLIGGQLHVASEGSAMDYIELLDYIEANELSIESSYNYVISKIDIGNYIDYAIAEMFLANYDWPGNNIKIWRPSDGTGKWRWIFYDLDGALIHPDLNMLEHCTLNDPEIFWPNSPSATFLFRNLIKNSSFTERFTERYAQLLASTFSASQMLSKAIKVKGPFIPEMQKHIDRWAFPSSVEAWEDAIEYGLIDFLEKRPCEVQKNLVDFFQLEEFGFDCNLVADFGTLVLGPNPSDGNFILLNNSFNTIRGDLIISTLSGATIYSEMNIYLGAFESIEIRLTETAQGMYLVNFEGVNSSNTLKLVIQ